MLRLFLIIESLLLSLQLINFGTMRFHLFLFFKILMQFLLLFPPPIQDLDKFFPWRRLNFEIFYSTFFLTHLKFSKYTNSTGKIKETNFVNNNFMVFQVIIRYLRNMLDVLILIVHVKVLFLTKKKKRINFILLVWN